MYKGWYPGSQNSKAGKAWERLVRNLYLDLGEKHPSSVFLAVSGRSGTTWASDIASYGSESRYVFAPVHQRKVGVTGVLRSGQYVRPDDEREEYLSPARAILSGGVRDGWVDRYYKTCLSRKRLVKDIRTHLMLGWIHARFPGMQIIFLLRHPCAVVTSKIKLGWNTPDLETTFLAQEELVRDFLLPFADATKQARTSFERHVFAWCVENYVPLMQLLGQEGVQLVLYE